MWNRGWIMAGMFETKMINKLDRIPSLDFWRGVILMIMALDHANIFIANFHHKSEFWNMPLPVYPTVAHFLTRFVTHFCAPGFFLLMGIGMALFAKVRRQGGWTEARITAYFLKRGVLLVLMQFIIENPIWMIGGSSKDLGYLGVVVALGFSMMGWSVLRLLNRYWILILSLVFISSSLFFPISDELFSRAPLFLKILFIPEKSKLFRIYYPVLPWIGIAGIGVFAGRQLLRNRASAFRQFLLFGFASLALFAIFRTLIDFGNIHKVESVTLYNVLNLTKYPPELNFILLTVGANLIFLSLSERIYVALAGGRLRFMRCIEMFGNVPLFFYFAHLLTFALIGLVIYDQGLIVTYAVWLAALVPLYYLCKYYRSFKFGKPAGSIWRLF